MNNVHHIRKLNEQELSLGLTDEQSWHMQWKNNAWVYVGGLAYELTEGDVICVFSQWGEIEDAHLVRDEATGKSKGFAFIKYEDWRSTVLAVDNGNGASILGRNIRVDHTDYRPPKEKRAEGGEDKPAQPKNAHYMPGEAYNGRELASEYSLKHGVDLYAPARVDPGNTGTGRVDEEERSRPRKRRWDDGQAEPSGSQPSVAPLAHPPSGSGRLLHADTRGAGREGLGASDGGVLATAGRPGAQYEGDRGRAQGMGDAPLGWKGVRTEPERSGGPLDWKGGRGQGGGSRGENPAPLGWKGSRGAGR